MAQGNVDIVISPQGEIEIKATGFKGKACEQATKEIEEALGTVSKRTKTPESYITDKTGAKIQVGR